MADSNFIFKDLGEYASEGLDAYYSNYVKNFALIGNIMEKWPPLTSSIDGKTFAADKDVLRFSLMFNDLSLLHLRGGSSLSIVAPTTQEAFASVFKEGIEVIGNAEVITAISQAAGGNIQLAPGFVLANDEESKRILPELSPLIKQGRLLIAPTRIVMYVERQEPSGRKHWKMLEVAQNSPTSTWLLRSEDPSGVTPIVYGADAMGSDREIFEITLPYLSGISYATLAEILADEGDLSSSLRVALKQALNEVKHEGRAKEIISDVVEPKIGMIERRLKSLTSRYAMSLSSATLATASLGLTTFVSTSSVVASVAAVAGVGGLGLITKEYSSWREKSDAMKEDPYYLLWRCKKLNR